MICAQGLGVDHGPRRTLDGVDLEVRAGQIVGLLGVNGAGKTTLLRALAGELAPSRGQLHVGGLDVASRPHEARLMVGFMPEPAPPLEGDWRAGEYVEHACRLHALAREARADAQACAAQAKGLLQLCGLHERAGSPVRALSHGYRKRLGLALALVGQPQALLLDEPLSGLDPTQLAHARGVLRQQAQRGCAVLISSHMLDQLEHLCDEVVLLQAGQVTRRGSVETLRLGPGATKVRLLVRGEGELAQQALASCGLSAGAWSQAAPGVWSVQVEADLGQREAMAKALVERGLGLLELAPQGRALDALFESADAASAQTSERA